MKIYVAGHGGMVGSALCRQLKTRDCQIITRTREELDLLDQRQVRDFFRKEQPDAVIIAAAKVGGIHANDSYPAEFIHENLVIQSNLIHETWLAGVRKLLFLGSSCIYPKMAEQPIKEEYLLTSPLEPTNEAYAIAKIAGLKLCEFYRQQHGCLFHSAMPCNLYGIGDNYHPKNSHVIPGLIRRFHESVEAEASSVTIWGTGSPLREFLFADDLADGCLHLMGLDDPPSLVNIGVGSDVSILELAKLIAETVGFDGKILTDPSKPDGTPRKLMDSSLIRSLGWEAATSLEGGLKLAYQDFLKNGI